MIKIIKFESPTCQPCKLLTKTLSEIDVQYPIEIVDISIEHERASLWNIRTVPTLVMTEAGGEIKRLIGYKSAFEVEKWINT
jgi:thioredoxin-like negative regulator of GroEL